MNTLKEIQQAARDTSVVTSKDHATPEGHFIATTIILGVLTTYLLRGEIDTSTAPIVGRVEAPERRGAALNCYEGNGVKGGGFFSAWSYEEAFARMV